MNGPACSILMYPLSMRHRLRLFPHFLGPRQENSEECARSRSSILLFLLQMSASCRGFTIYFFKKQATQKAIRFLSPVLVFSWLSSEIIFSWKGKENNNEGGFIYTCLFGCFFQSEKYGTLLVIK